MKAFFPPDIQLVKYLFNIKWPSFFWFFRYFECTLFLVCEFQFNFVHLKSKIFTAFVWNIVALYVYCILYPFLLFFFCSETTKKFTLSVSWHKPKFLRFRAFWVYTHFSQFFFAQVFFLIFIIFSLLCVAQYNGLVSPFKLKYGLLLQSFLQPTIHVCNIQK